MENKIQITFTFDPVTKTVSNVEMVDLNLDLDLSNELVTFKITTLQLSDNVVRALELKPNSKLGIQFRTDGEMFLVNPKYHTSYCQYNITGKNTVSVRTVTAKSFLSSGDKFKCVQIERGKIQLIKC